MAIGLVILNHPDIRILLKMTLLSAVLPAQLLADRNYSGDESILVFFVNPVF